MLRLYYIRSPISVLGPFTVQNPRRETKFWKGSSSLSSQAASTGPGRRTCARTSRSCAVATPRTNLRSRSVTSAKILFLRNASSSARGVAGVMSVYGVVGVRLKRVMYVLTLSSYRRAPLFRTRAARRAVWDRRGSRAGSGREKRCGGGGGRARLGSAQGQGRAAAGQGAGLTGFASFASHLALSAATSM